MEEALSSWLWDTPPPHPSLCRRPHLAFPQHQRMKHDTTCVLPQHKCFMGWHLATSAINVFSSMTQTRI